MERKAPARRSRRPAWWAGGALVIGLALTAFATDWQVRRNAERVGTRFDAVAARAADAVGQRMRRYEFGLRGARGAAIAADLEGLDTGRFHRYAASRDIAREFAGARGFGIVLRVAEADLPAFVDRAKSDGAPQFAVRGFGVQEGDRFLIRYVEPLQGNEAAIGLDIASEPNRRAAAVDAMRQGRATLTGPIRLVQTSGSSERGFLVLLPIYRTGAVPDTPAEREAATYGWSYAPLVIDDVLRDFDFDGGDFALALSDRSGPGAPVPFYASAGAEQAPAADAVRRVSIPIYGRTWEAEIRARPSFVAGLSLIDPRVVAAAGAALSGLLALLAWLYEHSARRSAQLRAEKARRAAIVDASNDAMVSATLDGTITSWNRAAELIFGHVADDAIGRPLHMVLPDANSGYDEASFLARAARGESIAAFDAKLRRRDASSVEVSISASPLRDAAGRVAGTGMTIRDIGDRKAAERQLRELSDALEAKVVERTAGLEAARRDLQTILDAVPSMIGYWDRNLVNRFANQAFHSWFDVDPATLPGRAMRDLLGADAFDDSLPHIEAVLAGAVQTFERSMPAPGGGSMRHSTVHYLPDVFDGEVRGFYAFVHDVTDRKRAEIELVRIASLLRTILESASEAAIVAVDTDGTVNVFNRGAERMLGYDRSEVVGVATSAQFHDREALRARAAELSERKGRRVRTGMALIDPDALGRPYECDYVRKDGSRVRVSLVVTAMHNEQGDCFGYLGVAHDVTRQVQYEATLHEAVRHAEQANAAKSRFLANMSHEIRTPMNAVIGLSYLLGQTPLDDGQRDLLGKVQLAGKSLLGILNDILDLSKIEAGELSAEIAPFDLGALLGDLSDVMHSQAESKGIAFAIDLPDALPRRLLGDALRIQQILANLVSNAIKFTAVGRVVLVARAAEAPAGTAALRFEVIDTGIGISDDDAKRLFEPFAQADASTTRRFGGTGLGLSIVRQLAQLMGGRVGLESTAGAGSIFWVELPLAFDASVAPDGPAADRFTDAPSGLSGVRVLVVDDSRINLEVAQRILQLEGAEVVLAENGREAVEWLRDPAHVVDVVLMDVQMPVLDGHGATRAIRGELGLVDLPIVALTADALTSQREAARAAGMDDFLVKPFEPRAVVARILRLLPARPGPATVARPEPAQPAAVARPAGWPEVPGVDAASVAARFGGDAALFRRLLRHLVSDFAAPPGLVVPAVATNAQLAALAGRFHKLKGGAGNLGATVLHEAASRAERACRAGDAATAAALAASIRAEVDAIAACVAGWREEPSASESSSSAAAPIDAASLDELVSLLRAQRFEAVDRFEAHAGALRATFGADVFEAVRGHVDQLRFAQAAELLAAEATAGA